MPSTKKAAKRAPRTTSNDETISKHLMKAVEDGDTAAVATWLDGGGQVDAASEAMFTCTDGSKSHGLTMLMLASGLGHEDLVDLLLTSSVS